MMYADFLCTKCGECCKHLYLSSFYDDLHNGDGICIYFDLQNNLCKIYENRPEKCNIKESYKYFKDYIDYEKYLELNYDVCKKLRGKNSVYRR